MTYEQVLHKLFADNWDHLRIVAQLGDTDTFTASMVVSVTVPPAVVRAALATYTGPKVS